MACAIKEEESRHFLRYHGEVEDSANGETCEEGDRREEKEEERRKPEVVDLMESVIDMLYTR